MSDPVLHTIPLGDHWPTLDPFLFCVHHVDRYPAGRPDFGPAAPLAGRQLGQDFAGIDGWRMYHGLKVPGFPQHPHRGFETVTIARHGYVDHSDSLGATARFGQGDVQWLTAGAGIVHAEMFPLLDPRGPNTLELFQIWLNLPARDKLAPPHFRMFWNGDIPRLTFADAHGQSVRVRVIAGALGTARPLDPPPHSWASRAEADLAIWSAELDPGAVWSLPPAQGEATQRVIYAFSTGRFRIGGRNLEGPVAVQVDAQQAVDIQVQAVAPEPGKTAAEGGATAMAECLVLQGRPIGEPVVQRGPFVMNSDAEIRRAIADYQRTEFGGWPWPDDGPVHGPDPARFARHASGEVEAAVEGL